MPSLSSLVLLGLLWLPCIAHALSEFQILDVVHKFSEHYVYPDNIAVADSINSTLFAEDVLGTVDVSTNFDGRELATEYLFGLFAQGAKEPEVPHLYGYPVDFTVTKMFVQNMNVAVNLKFQYMWPVLKRTFPIEIFAFFTINEASEVQEYDVSFRRITWAMQDVIIPELIPHHINYVKADFPNMNVTEDNALRLFYAKQICDAADAYCTGENQQYDSHAACIEYAMAKDEGTPAHLGGDNLACRYIHTLMVHLRPSVHCAHIGPSGGGMCIPRNYTEVVMEDHFPHGFVAPMKLTPENGPEIDSVRPNLRYGTDLPGLLGISLMPADARSWDPTVYATCTFGFLLVLHFASKLLHFAFSYFHNVYPTLTGALKRNCVMYVLNIFFTTAILALQLSGVPNMKGQYSVWGIKCLRTGAAMCSGLYTFELIYRKMRWPMVVHHLATIIVLSMVMAGIEITKSMTYITTMVAWGFQATTEQPIFFGLLGYRLGWNVRRTALLLKFAAVQALIFKTASAIVVLVWWGLKQRWTASAWDRGFSAIVWILCLALFCTQIWGSWITWMIGARLDRQRRRADSNSGVSADLSHLPQTHHLRKSNSRERNDQDGGRSPEPRSQLRRLRGFSLKRFSSGWDSKHAPRDVEQGPSAQDPPAQLPRGTPNATNTPGASGSGTASGTASGSGTCTSSFLSSEYENMKPPNQHPAEA